jgi:hypothetical protein
MAQAEKETEYSDKAARTVSMGEPATMLRAVSGERILAAGMVLPGQQLVNRERVPASGVATGARELASKELVESASMVKARLPDAFRET